MKPTLTFESLTLRGSALGPPACVPDLVGQSNVQNKTRFDLGENEEIFERYGVLRGAYPYPPFNAYDRTLREIRYQAAVLENDRLRAVFLPEMGGRLWRLYDKRERRDILYTNDVLRFSNLAIREAWFSGGAEWNVSMIGHTPFTTAPLYAARLEKEDGTPILRMYEYERVRRVTYQMDFWLEEGGSELNCRMRISNTGAETVPMYWWTNMAVPEYQGGRIVVPARSAYTSSGREVIKTPIPLVHGKDVTFYENTDKAVDYFFDQDRDKPSYIANLSPEGYGFLHVASRRVQAHKLFSWGHDENAAWWQRFLTEKAGPYIEVQGGLGKTQYGCIPMPPHSAWEWSERFCAVQVEKSLVQLPYDQLEQRFTARVAALCREKWPDLEQAQPFTKKPAEVFSAGSGYGFLRGRLLQDQDERPLDPHLTFASDHGAAEFWLRYLDAGRLPEMPAGEKPLDHLCDRELYERLCETTQGPDKANWYAWYQMGVYCVWKEDFERGEKLLTRSFKLKENPWSCHALCSLYLLTQDTALANLFMRRGLALYGNDLSYVKEGFRLLILGGGYEEILLTWPRLSEALRQNGRLRYFEALALIRTGDHEKARALLNSFRDDALDDRREGMDPIGELRREVEKALHQS